MNKKQTISILAIIIFLYSLGVIDWDSDLVHGNGFRTLSEMLSSILRPNLSTQIVRLALISAWRTLAYALVGMFLALVFALILGPLAANIFFKTKKISILTRNILGFMRSIHELIWAWLFVASFGLSPYCALFAIGISYGGVLGRIFADILEDVPQGPIESLKQSGANSFQLLIYGYFPIALPNMISYTLYRLECAIRSSTIMSFVGLGGLGYQIHLSLSDLAYSEVWTFLFFLIALVVAIDIFSNQIRKNINSNNNTKILSLNYSRISVSILALLTLISWIFIVVADDASFLSLFSAKNLTYSKKFLNGLLGVGNDNPAFLSLDAWKKAISLSFQTLKMSIVAIAFSTILMFLTVLFGSKNFAYETKGIVGKSLFWIIRAFYVLTRAVPELIWAMIIIFILKPGVLPGALALGLHNYGILGKLCSEVIEDLDQRPLNHLKNSGATKLQVLIYGIVPAAFPKFITYILYRWEVILRTTIIVGFVGAGGLGLWFKLSMSWFHYTNITLIIICYLGLVFMVDHISNYFRKVVNS